MGHSASEHGCPPIDTLSHLYASQPPANGAGKLVRHVRRHMRCLLAMCCLPHTSLAAINALCSAAGLELVRGHRDRLSPAHWHGRPSSLLETETGGGEPAQRGSTTSPPPPKKKVLGFTHTPGGAGGARSVLLLVSTFWPKPDVPCAEQQASTASVFGSRRPALVQ